MRSGQRILILGATSSIARALAEKLGRADARLHLAGRDTEDLERIGVDIRIRTGADVTWSRLEATDYAAHPSYLAGVIDDCGGLDGVVAAWGELGDQQAAESDFAHAREIIDTNFVAVASILTPAANYLESQRHGFIVVISSVAGDRGRAPNYVYGAAKAGTNVFVQGLRARLSRAGVRVMTVKPGFVDTKMTFGMKGMFLVAAPDRVAEDILSALGKGKDVVYTPWFWSLIMFAFRSIPERVFKKLKV